MSNGNTYFKQATIENYGGISEDSPLVIIFDEKYSGITVFEGDEGTNKSSALGALEAGLGAIFPQYALNKKTGKVSVGIDFEDENGEKYRTKVTRTQFKLEKFVNIAGTNKWVSSGEDKSLIRKIMPYATSPDVLMDMEGSQQLTWLRTVAGATADDTALVEMFKKSYKERTSKNNEVKIFKQQLLDSKNFVLEGKDISPTEEYETHRKEVVTQDLDTVEKYLLESLSKLKVSENTLNRAIAEISTLEYQMTEKEKRIKELQKEIEDLNERQLKGREYIEANKTIPDQIKQIESELQNTRDVKSIKESVLTTTRLFEQYKKSTDESTALTSHIDDITKQREAIAKSFTPPIPNFEVNLGDLDESKKGLFLNGINIAALSESERYALCIQIWQHYGTKVVFIENISSLGSHALEIIKLFIKNGGTVFGTQMNRGQQSISVSFSLNE